MISKLNFLMAYLGTLNMVLESYFKELFLKLDFLPPYESDSIMPMFINYSENESEFFFAIGT